LSLQNSSNTLCFSAQSSVYFIHGQQKRSPPGYWASGKEKIMITNRTTTCFTVQNGKIVKGTLADFTCFIETTTRPNGMGYKYYVISVNRDVERATDRVDEDGYIITETVEDDVWVLAKWASWGGPQVIIREFESEQEANAAAEETYIYDILNNSEISIHFCKNDAAAELTQLGE
jgi:hypothetical protein